MIRNTVTVIHARLDDIFKKWTGALLALVTVISSIPFTSKYLYHIDSVQYALGMHHFSIVDFQPHPPGYPVYVTLGRIVSFFLHDDNLVLVVLSIAFAAAGVVFFYRLALAMTRDRAASAVTTVFLIFNPLFWFYREVALNYTSEFMTFAGVGLITYRIAFEGRSRYFYLLALLLAFSFGIRPSIFMLAPICMFAALYVRKEPRGFSWTAFYRGLDWKTIAGGTCLGVAGVLVWFIPVVTVTGGFSSYYSLLDRFWNAALKHTSVLAGPPGSFGLLWKYYYRTLLVGIAGIPLMLICGAIMPFLKSRTTGNGIDHQEIPGRGKTVVFMTVWVVPAFLTYILGHFGQPGYHLSVLPAIYILSAFGTALFIKKRLLVPVMVILLAAQMSCFLFLPPIGLQGRCDPSIRPPSGIAKTVQSINRWLLYYNAGQIREHDESFAGVKNEIDKTIRRAVSADGRGIMLVVPQNLIFHSGDEACVNELYYRHIQYYYPRIDVVVLNAAGNYFYRTRDYRVYQKNRRAEAVQLGAARTIVIVAQGIDDVDLPSGLVLRKGSNVYTGMADESFSFHGFTFSR